MSEPRIPQKSSRRIRIVWIVLLALVVLMVAGAIALKAILTPERLRAQIIRGTQSAIGVEPSLDAVSLTLLPFGVRLEKFAIPGAAPGDPPFFAIDEGRARVSLLPLLKRMVVVDEIALVHPQVQVRRDGDRYILPGKLGAPPSPSGAPPSSETPAAGALPKGLSRFAIRSYAIDRGSVRILTEGAKEDVSLEGITLRGTLDAREGGRIVSSEGTLALDGLSLSALALYEETLKRLKPELRYRLAFDAPKGLLRIEEAALVAKPLELAGKGEIRGIPKTPVLDFTIAPGRHDVAELVPLVPTAIIPEGRTLTGSGHAELAAHVEAHLADTTMAPSYDLRAVLENVALAVEGFPAGIEGANGTIHATPARIELQEVVGKLAGEPFRLHGTIDDPADSTKARYDLQVRARAQLDVLARAGFAPPGGTLSGTLDADFTARGSAADPANAKLDGSIVAEGVHAKLPAMRLPVENVRSRVLLRGDRATIESLSGKIGRTSFEAKGEVRNPLSKPEIVLEGRAPILDLNELLPPASPPADSSSGHALLRFVVAEAWAASAAPPLVPVVPPLPMKLTLAVDSLFTGENVFAGGTMHATTRDGRAKVEGTFAHAKVGTVELKNLTVDATVENGRLEGTFSAPRADAPRVPLTEVKGKFDLGEDRVLHVNDVAARLWDGAVSGAATIDLTELTSPAFRIESKVQRIQANALVSSLTPAKDFISGTMDMTSVIAGKGSVPDAIARTLAGEGSVVASNGKISLSPTVAAVWRSLGLPDQKSIQFNALTSAFQLQGGRLVTKDLAVRGSDANWNANGSVAMDGGIDYDVTVELGEELSNAYRKKMGRDLAQLLAGSSGRLLLDLKISGNAKAPKVSVDTSKLAERARANATDAATKAIEKEASKALEKILGAPTPADSGKAPGAAKPESTVQKLLEGLFKRK